MKITFGDYEVEIKAKAKGHNKANTEDTQYLLNELASKYREASLFLSGNGYQNLAHRAFETSKEIYNTLESQGFYKDKE